MEYRFTCASPLGPLTLVSDGADLQRLWFAGQQPSLPDTPGRIAVLAEAGNWLERYFAGLRPDPTVLPLAPVGTAFQQTVWQLLREIPYGETTSYGALARILADRRGLPRMSAQAVGGAVGRNPLPIFLPCHRVIGANGRLVGYSGGLERKQWLLQHEKNA